MIRTYATWADLQRALSSRGRAHAKEHGISPGRLGELQLRDRLLVRIFAGDPEGWMLKGGTSMLARNVRARTTRDVDLVAHADLDAAVARLVELVDRDFGDHLRFRIRGRGIATTTVGGRTTQRVTFDAFAGTARVGVVQIDLVVGSQLTSPPTLHTPSLRVPVPGLPVADYRLYPTVHAVADKVAATLTTYATGESTRDHDLVDLVILAVTETFDASSLSRTITEELILRQIEVPETFTLPARMAPGYVATARTVADCSGHPQFEDADRLMQTFITPLLDGSRTSGIWTHPSWA